MFSMQEANLDLFARRGVALESVFNPTLLSQGLTSGALATYFMSYADDSRLRVRTATGTIDMDTTGAAAQRLRRCGDGAAKTRLRCLRCCRPP